MSSPSKSEFELAATTPHALADDSTVPRKEELAATIPSDIQPADPSSGPDQWVGTRVDHFRLERHLGSGGMGSVYAAHDMSLDRKIAIKILPIELAPKAEAQERFIREARAQARLTSPHVVRIYYIGRVPPPDGVGKGSLYFAMELVDGESLEAYLGRKERLDPELARTLMIQVSQGLRDAHAAGIVHRDIKPGNLLVDRNGRLKIADFGLAKPSSSPALGLTRQGAIVGTPLYMAPEQARGDPLDHRADMYSLGCTFRHLITGCRPFDGRTSVEVMSKHLTDQPVPIREQRADIPHRLARILDRLLSKDPKDRYRTHNELIAALEAAAPETIEYAGFWTRGAAAIIDAIIASALIAAVGWPGLLVYIVYLTGGHAFWGQTLAKRALRIQVKRVDGRPLGLGHSLFRTAAGLWLPFLVGLLILWSQGIAGLTSSIGKLAELTDAKALIAPFIVSNVVLTLLYGSGFALALFHPERRAVHDLVAGTHVLYQLRAQKVVPRVKS